MARRTVSAYKYAYISTELRVARIPSCELYSKPQPTRLSADSYFSLVVIQLRGSREVDQLSEPANFVYLKRL